ncbi:hypothetical protein GQ42DRAFT_166071, partial [Ramicandelaber brevisporus]
MNISKLLNPVPNKKPRFDEDTLVCDKYWLPTELIAIIISFFSYISRPNFQLLSKKWYTAYEQYFRNKVFNDVLHIKDRGVTRSQLVNTFVKHGHRLRWMFINTSTLREILDFEPNIPDLIPNLIWLQVGVNDSLSSQRLMSDFVMKLGKLKRLAIHEHGFTADEHLADELDKAVAVLPRLDRVVMHDVDLDLSAFPRPNMKERARQILELMISVANIEPGTIASRITVFINVTQLGLSGISGVDILKDVTEMVVDEKNFRKLRILDVRSELDLSHVDPIVNEDGTTVTAMDLYLKICGIQRPKFELNVGFILGACSKTNSVLIEKEREFVINMGKTGSGVLSRLGLTHYKPSGDYDPLTTFFYESASRYSKLKYLALYVSPTAATGPRVIEALNNPFLLPHLIQAIIYVDDMHLPEWNCEYDPINRSRGLSFRVIDMQHEDEMRMINENINGTLPSFFLA